MRPSFSDASLQAAFEQDGFVVLPLLDEATVTRIQEFYDAQDHPQKDRGFHASCHLDDAVYRRAMRDGIAAEALPAIFEHLTDHRLVSANFVVKEPGQGEMPMHQDWAVVDEREFTSVTVWCPLVEDGPQNGALHLLRASHRHIVTARGENEEGLPNFVTAYEQIPPEVIAAHDMTLNLHAGEAVLYDTRTVHFSPPNESTTTRVAINVTLAPQEAPLLHHYRSDEKTVELIGIDETFFTDHPIDTRPTGEVLATVPYRFEITYPAPQEKSRHPGLLSRLFRR